LNNKYIFSEIHRPVNCSHWDILLRLKHLFLAVDCVRINSLRVNLPATRNSDLYVHNWLHSITSFPLYIRYRSHRLYGSRHSG